MCEFYEDDGAQQYKQMCIFLESRFVCKVQAISSQSVDVTHATVRTTENTYCTCVFCTVSRSLLTLYSLTLVSSSQCITYRVIKVSCRVTKMLLITDLKSDVYRIFLLNRFCILKFIRCNFIYS